MINKQKTGLKLLSTDVDVVHERVKEECAFPQLCDYMLVRNTNMAA